MKNKNRPKMPILFVCFKLSRVNEQRRAVWRSHGQSINCTCLKQNVSILNFSFVTIRQSIGRNPLGQNFRTRFTKFSFVKWNGIFYFKEPVIVHELCNLCNEFLRVSSQCINYAAVDQLEFSEQNSCKYHFEREENFLNSIKKPIPS